MTARGYVITGTPRSGSTYLCRLLTGTQVLGVPEEWLDQRTFSRLTKEAAPRRFDWDAIVRRASTANGVYGVYGVKVFSSQVDAALVEGAIETIASMPIIHLERRDLLAQALSWSRAAQTGRWQDHQSVKRQAVFAPELIDFALRRIAEDNARWRLFFVRNEVVPLYVAYEDYVGDPQATIAAVAALLNVDVTHAQLAIEEPPALDPVTNEWRERYLAACRGSGLPRLRRSLLDRGRATTHRLRRGAARLWT